MPRAFANRALSRSLLFRWTPTFLGFPVGGSPAMLLTGPVDAPLLALGGAINAFAYILWSLWLIATAIVLLRVPLTTATTPHAAWPVATGYEVSP